MSLFIYGEMYMNENGKRMAGVYEIIDSVRIGNSEVVLGVNEELESGKYYCGYCDSNELLDLYINGATCDSYPAIVDLYGQRIKEEAEKVIESIKKDKEIVGDDRELKLQDCTPFSYEDNVVNKVVVIKGEILRPEFRRASHQLLYVTGGNGAYANARGRKVFTKSLVDGQSNVFYRQDILGIVDVEKLPKWAKTGYDKIIKEKDRGER